MCQEKKMEMGRNGISIVFFSLDLCDMIKRYDSTHITPNDTKLED
jgi:hypothetical protein